MRRILWLQICLAIAVLAAMLFVESGKARLDAPLNAYKEELAAYRSLDHTGEVVFLGSSVIGCGIIPEAVRNALAERDIERGVYCFYLPGATAPSYRTLVRDVLADHGRPRLLVLGLYPPDLNSNSPKLKRYVEDVATAGDLWQLLRSDPWGHHSLGWTFLSRSPSILLQMVFPPGRPSRATRWTIERLGARWWYKGGDPEATARNTEMVAGELTERRYESRLVDLRELLQSFRADEFEVTLRETIAEARAMGVPVATCMCEYSDRAKTDLDGGHLEETWGILEGIARELDVPLWRTNDVWDGAREWSAYIDGSDHLRPDSAMELSRATAEGPLGDLLGEE